MRDFMDIIKSRRSTRSFIPGKLPPRTQIEELLEAAQWAPTGQGKQLWHFTVIYNAEKSLELAKRISEIENRGPNYNFYLAPVQILISYQRDEQHAYVDGAAALQNVLLAAENLGLGSCWINQVRAECDHPDIRPLLTTYGVPTDHIVIGSAAIGYIETPTPAKPRLEGTISFVE